MREKGQGTHQSDWHVREKRKEKHHAEEGREKGCAWSIKSKSLVQCGMSHLLLSCVWISILTTSVVFVAQDVLTFVCMVNG